MRIACLLASAAALVALATPAFADPVDEDWRCEKGAVQGYNDLYFHADTNEVVYVRGNMNLNLVSLHVDAGSFAGNVSGENTAVKFDRHSGVMTVTTNGKPASYHCKKVPPGTP